MVDQDDELWPHLAPLWTELRNIAPGLLLAGGYGLFLKQKWLLLNLSHVLQENGVLILTEAGDRLLTEGSVPTLVSIARWKDPTPRVTNDLDFVVELDLIASVTEQQRLDTILATYDFKVVEKNARWQFEKVVDANRRVILDFHAPSPDSTRNDLRVQSRRVKPHPSLGQTGIPGRENPEAVGCELYPFTFHYGGVDIAIPNPVTLTCMKLAAMRDRRRRSQNSAKPAEQRVFDEAQARKHAQDVCRVVGMITRDESDSASQVSAKIQATGVFADPAEIFKTYFVDQDAWGTQTVSGGWETDDFQLIHRTLATWFQ